MRSDLDELGLVTSGWQQVGSWRKLREATGRLWEAVEGYWGLWKAVEGYGRL